LNNANDALAAIGEAFKELSEKLQERGL